MTYFEVLGFEGQVLGLEADKSSKMPCSRPGRTLFFDLLKMGQGHDFFFFVLEHAIETSRIILKVLFWGGGGERLSFAEIFAIYLLENLFFWSTLARCGFGPWLWPRAFLSLVSRESVLGKSVLGLGLGFFCCLDLEPGVLDSTSDMDCHLQTNN